MMLGDHITRLAPSVVSKCSAIVVITKYKAAIIRLSTNPPEVSRRRFTKPKGTAMNANAKEAQEKD